MEKPITTNPNEKPKDGSEKPITTNSNEKPKDGMKRGTDPIDIPTENRLRLIVNSSDGDRQVETGKRVRITYRVKGELSGGDAPLANVRWKISDRSSSEVVHEGKGEVIEVLLPGGDYRVEVSADSGERKARRTGKSSVRVPDKAEVTLTPDKEP